MTIKKKILLQMASCFICAAFMISNVFAVNLSAEAAIVMDADSGRILLQKKSDRKMLIASITKIMTAIVAIESSRLQDTVEISASHMAEGSSMYLKPGETLTMEELLYGLMLPSGNDAALAIADHCGPGIDQFIKKMNDKAQELGMEHSSFANPNGLDDPNHYSSAKDMAILASYAMKNDTFARIVSTKNIKIGNRYLINHNKLLSKYEGCIGVKTGYTKAAGRTLVSCAQRGNFKIVTVTLKDPDDWTDHIALYDWAFSEFELKKCVKKGQVIGTVPILNSSVTSVPLLSSNDFYYPVRTGEKIKVMIERSDCAFAPVEQHEQAGNAIICLDGEILESIPLEYGCSVSPAIDAEYECGFWEFLHNTFNLIKER